jgi:hypothetical protein
MIGAAYFRELYLQKLQHKIVSLQQEQYKDNISKDLLNPVFSSLVTRDMIAPLRNFRINNNSYILDRGYAFEQKLNANTRNIFNKNLDAYALPEQNAVIPCMLFYSAIMRDGRKLLISTQRVRFMMQAVNKPNHFKENDIDALDYQSFFKNQDPGKLRFLSVLRMNATFPFVLPNVEMPSNPRIDVMDGGFRDNFGHETTMRFLDVFKNWLKENTSKVVVVEIRDRAAENWSRPYEIKSIAGLITKPMFLLQSNWFNLQDYYEKDQVNYMLGALDSTLYFTSFSYEAPQNAVSASLSFHLTTFEKKSIAETLDDKNNQQTFKHILEFLSKK